MRVVIQRVSEASVQVENKNVEAIQKGLLVLAGFEEGDDETDIEWMVSKIVQLRIFNDADGVMNRSIIDAGGSMLIVSQFTLHASTKKGNRPSYIRAARPGKAIPLYESLVRKAEAAMGKPVATGVFGADMKVHLINDGPVTIIMDSKNRE